MRNPFRPRRQRLDLYEQAAERLEHARQARQELGDAFEGLPPDIVRTPGLSVPRRGWLLLLVLAMIAGGVLYATVHNRPPTLPVSCTTPAFQLSTDSEHRGRLVSWSATGPKGRYVLGLDTAALSVAQDGTVSGDVVGRPFAMARCEASGEVSLTMPVGEHTLRLFRLTGGGAQSVDSARLTVTP